MPSSALEMKVHLYVNHGDRLLQTYHVCLSLTRKKIQVYTYIYTNKKIKSSYGHTGWRTDSRDGGGGGGAHGKIKYGPENNLKCIVVAYNSNQLPAPYSSMAQPRCNWIEVDNGTPTNSYPHTVYSCASLCIAVSPFKSFLAALSYLVFTLLPCPMPVPASPANGSKTRAPLAF